MNHVLRWRRVAKLGIPTNWTDISEDSLFILSTWARLPRGYMMEIVAIIIWDLTVVISVSSRSVCS